MTQRVCAPVWIALPTLHLLHDEQVELFGGARGVLSKNVLLSALHRPVDKWQYDRARLPLCAAAYLWGLVHAHGYVDGNKRSALMASLAFLWANGRRIDVPHAELFAMALAAARKEVGEPQIGEWFRRKARRAG